MLDKHGLLTSSISHVLRRMAVPTTLGMIAILMFNLVDTFFVSLLGTQALAAISFTFPVTFAINCVTMGVGIGLSTHLARLLGRKSPFQATRFASHGLLLSLCLIFAFSSVGFFALDPLFLALGSPASLLPLIHQYMDIWFLTIPLLAISMTSSSILRSTGDTKTSAKMMILSGVINGVFDPLFIFGYGPFPEMGIQGAAIASALSWLVSSIGLLYVLSKREKMLAMPQWPYLVADWQQILKVGAPAALSNAMAPLSGALLMMILSTHGTIAIAAYGAVQRIEPILTLVLMSLSSALTPFMAQNIGANQTQRCFSGLFISMRFSLIFQLLVFIAMIPLSIPLSALFSQEQSVQNLLWHYLLVVPFSYGFQGMAMMLNSGLNALHKPLHAFLWSGIRLFIFTLPSAYLGSYWYGIAGLFYGITLGNILAGSLSYWIALRLRKQSQLSYTTSLSQ